jgi:hypothetical protein
VSGVVGNLAAGDYQVGLCAMNETANVAHGSGGATVILAETQSGATTVSRRGSRAAAQRP